MYEPLVPGEISAVTSTPKANTPPPAAPTHLRTGPAASGPTANATGGADALIEAAAPPSGMVASVEARLRADEALALAGPEGIIDELEGSRLDDAVRSLGGIINATHGRMVLSVCRVLDTGWWKGGGVLSARQWLAIHWATNTATISRVVSVAKKAETYPEVIDALVAGMISLEAAHLICGRIPSEYQTTYVAYAINMTFDQLRTCTHAVRPPPNSGRNKQADKAGEDDASGDDKAGQTTADEPTSANPPPRLGFTQRDDGRWSLNANLSPEDGALIETALQEARDRAFKAAEDPDERLRLTWADALVDVARRALDHADADTAGGQPTDRTLVHYHYELGHLYTEGSTQPLPRCTPPPDPVRHQPGRHRVSRWPPSGRRTPNEGDLPAVATPHPAPGPVLCHPRLRGHPGLGDSPPDPLGRRRPDRRRQPRRPVQGPSPRTPSRARPHHRRSVQRPGLYQRRRNPALRPAGEGPVQHRHRRAGRHGPQRGYGRSRHPPLRGHGRTLATVVDHPGSQPSTGQAAGPLPHSRRHPEPLGRRRHPHWH
jgi:hypothetical protein